MTTLSEYDSTQPIKLSQSEQTLLKNDGAAAVAEIDAAAALSQPPPVGVWQKMYNDIFAMIGGASPPLVAPAGQQFWFSQAPFITSDNEATPSGYFVRDITAIGFGVSGPSAPSVQAVSDAIGTAIYNSIKANDVLPAFWLQLSYDIYSALGGGTTPYVYPQLPVAGWGGTFYYFNAPYNPNQPVNIVPTTPPQTSIAQYVLNNSVPNQTFITNDAQAIADSATHFLSSGVQLNTVVSSILGTSQGAQTLWNSGWQGKLDLAKILINAVADFEAEGGVGSALSTALWNYVTNFESLFIGDNSASIVAPGGSAVLVGGQGFDSAGNDTLVGTGGSDTFLINLPSSGAVTETITDSVGLGQIIVASPTGQLDTLGGSAANPLTAVAGQQDEWQDAGGTQYAYTPSNDELTISGGYLGAGNDVVVDDFNPALAAGSNSYAGSSGGDIGIFLPESLNLTAGATVGTDPPATFAAGSTQSYTLSVDAPSNVAQNVTVTLSGAPSSSFEALVGSTLTILSAVGTFTVSLPAGETNITFGLVNTSASPQSADLTLTASIPNPLSSGSSISTTPLVVDYQGASSVAQSQATLYGANSGPGYFADSYPSVLDLPRTDSMVGSPSGDDFVWIDQPNETATVGGNNDTILAEQGSTPDWSSVPGAFTTLVATGSQDVIENDSGQVAAPGPVAIYASGLESLSTAITAAQTGVGTGQQGDLIVGSSESPTTIVGSNGNDFITAADGSDVIVAAAGNDTIIGGVQSLYDSRYWNELPLQSFSFYPSSTVLESFSWSASYADPILTTSGIDYQGDTHGLFPDPAFPPAYVGPPPGYEGNLDVYCFQVA